MSIAIYNQKMSLRRAFLALLEDDESEQGKIILADIAFGATKAGENSWQVHFCPIYVRVREIRDDDSREVCMIPAALHCDEGILVEALRRHTKDCGGVLCCIGVRVTLNAAGISFDEMDRVHYSPVAFGDLGRLTCEDGQSLCKEHLRRVPSSVPEMANV